MRCPAIKFVAPALARAPDTNGQGEEALTMDRAVLGGNSHDRPLPISWD